MQADILIILSNWRYPVWSLSNLTTPHTLSVSTGIVGSVKESADAYEWHLNSTGEKGSLPSLERSKAACELAFWREAFRAMSSAARHAATERQADVAKILDKWEAPEWEQDDEEQDMWLLRQRGHGPIDIVGEIYGTDGGIRWRCTTSDQRVVVDDLELAKSQCECSFWREAWEQLRIAATGWSGAPCYTPKVGSPMGETVLRP